MAYLHVHFVLKLVMANVCNNRNMISPIKYIVLFDTFIKEKQYFYTAFVLIFFKNV